MLVLALASLAAAPAAAQECTTAECHLEQGLAARTRSDDAAAVEHFRAALALERTPRTLAQLAFAVQRLKDLKVFDGGDAATLGAGIITEARWKQTYDFMVAAGLLKPETDWKQGFTTQFVKDLKIMP